MDHAKLLEADYLLGEFADQLPELFLEKKFNEGSQAAHEWLGRIERFLLESLGTGPSYPHSTPTQHASMRPTLHRDAGRDSSRGRVLEI